MDDVSSSSDEENRFGDETTPLTPATSQPKQRRVLYDDMGDPIFLDGDDEEEESPPEHLPPPSFNPTWLATLASPPSQPPPRRQGRSHRTPFREPTIDRRVRIPYYSYRQQDDDDRHREDEPSPEKLHDVHFQEIPLRPALAPITNRDLPTTTAPSFDYSTASSSAAEPSLLSSTVNNDRVSAASSSRLYGASLAPSDSLVSNTSTTRSILSGMADYSVQSVRPPPRVSFATDIEVGRSYNAAANTNEQRQQRDEPGGMTYLPVQLWSTVQQQWSSNVYPTLRHVGQITSDELCYLSHVAARHLRRPPFVHQADSDGDEGDDEDLHDHLSYLQRVHKEKVGQLKQVQYDDHYDYALVLQPQAVYAFWADLLDFRHEILGEDVMTMLENDESTQGTEESDEASVVDARPFVFKTPSTGMRRRKASPTPHTAPPAAQREPDGLFTGVLKYDANGSIVQPRTSIFDRAIGLRPSLSGSKLVYTNEKEEEMHTPVPMQGETPMTNSTRATTGTRRRWGNASMLSPTPTRAGGTPLSSSAQAPLSRRRWGMSTAGTPVRSSSRRSLLSSRGSSLRKTRRASRMATEPSSSRGSVSDQDDDRSGRRRKQNPNSLRIEDIPTLRVPRGIAARTHGIIEFLAGLKRGIVVRRHRPGNLPVFCKLLSTDGGDTIKYQFIDEEEALMGFLEQRYRYNLKLDGEPFADGQDNSAIEDDQIQSLPIAECIAEVQRRQKKKQDKTGVSQKVVDLAFRAANSGTIRATDIISVHPAKHDDPRSTEGELGTASLRRSKADYCPSHTFSLVTNSVRTFGPKKGKSSVAGASEKWETGEGSDGKFRTIDFETWTEGEYWLIFRGFLLLHRDAAHNRFAQQRAAGIGSNVNRRDIEDADVLHKNEFQEPKTVGCLEQLIVKLRDLDDSYMKGQVAPGAVPPRSDFFLGFRSPGTEIWSRLRHAELETQRIYALDKRRVMLKIRCPARRITELAEVLRLYLKTREGTFAPFRESSIEKFQPLDDLLDSPASLGDASLFRSCERQNIIDFMIRSRVHYSGAGLGQATDLGNMILTRVPLHMHEKLDSLYNAWFYFWRRSNWSTRKGRSLSSASDANHSSSTFLFSSRGEHDRAQNEPRIPNIITRLVVGSFHQPLDSIEQYFGEKVAFYFAWLQHCSYHLIFLSIGGLIVFICQLSSGNWDHPLRPFFANAVMLWSFVVLVNWRKRSNLLAYRWGTLDHKEQETTRPQFKGEERNDEITNEPVLYYPSWKRSLKYLISFPLILLFTFGSLVAILMVHANRDLLLARYFEDKTNNESVKFEITFSLKAIGKRAPLNAVELTGAILWDPTFWFITAGLPALLGLCLPLLNFVLLRVAILLNDFENYRTETEYRTHLIVKVFSFRFVCYFATLYYYAFISVGTTQAIENGILRVGTGVFIYITVAHWWNIFLQVYFPLLIRRVRLYKQRKQLHEELRQVEMEEAELAAAEVASSHDNDQDEYKWREFEDKKVRLINRRLLLDEAQDEIWLETMLPTHDSFPEYIQAVVQFAYVTCFSVVLPITPLICLGNHLLSMRLDAYKLCRGRSRPLAQKTGGIGVWEHVLHIVTVIAVLTNCWVMGFASSQFLDIADKIGSLGLFCIVVGWEHIMLLIKYVMQSSISKLPKAVQDDIKCKQYKFKAAQNDMMRDKSMRRSKYSRDNSQFSKSEASDQSERWPSVEREDSNGGLRTIASSEEIETRSLHQAPTDVFENTTSKKRAVETVLEESSTTDSRDPTRSSTSTDRARQYKSKAPTPHRLEMDGEGAGGEVDGMDSPFSMFVPSQSFDTSPGPEDASKPSTSGKIDELLGKGIEEDGSLATFENEASYLQPNEEQEAAAEERIQDRLRRLEEKLNTKRK